MRCFLLITHNKQNTVYSKLRYALLNRNDHYEITITKRAIRSSNQVL